MALLPCRIKPTLVYMDTKALHDPEPSSFSQPHCESLALSLNTLQPHWPAFHFIQIHQTPIPPPTPIMHKVFPFPPRMPKASLHWVLGSQFTLPGSPLLMLRSHFPRELLFSRLAYVRCPFIPLMGSCNFSLWQFLQQYLINILS